MYDSQQTPVPTTLSVGYRRHLSRKGEALNVRLLHNIKNKVGTCNA